MPLCCRHTRPTTSAMSMIVMAANRCLRYAVAADNWSIQIAASPCRRSRFGIWVAQLAHALT